MGNHVYVDLYSVYRDEYRKHFTINKFVLRSKQMVIIRNGEHDLGSKL